MQEQQPEINVDNFSHPFIPLQYVDLCQIIGWCSVLMLIHIACIAVGADVDISC